MDKKIILIGKTGSGKTTLIQRIEALDMTYRKTQTIQNYLNFIDTPGEYLENRSYYKALIVTAADADVIGLVQDCSSQEVWLPPMFSSAFSKETIGIITKTDLARGKDELERARKALERSGATRFFCVSAAENAGLGELTAYIRG